MKKQIVAPLILILGLTTIYQPAFAMKRSYPQPSDSISAMVSTFVVTVGWIWARQVNILQSLGSHTTFVSAQGTQFVVPSANLQAFQQSSPTIADLLGDLEGQGISEIPLDSVSDPALYLISQMASGAPRHTLLRYIRSLSADELEKLKQDARYLDSTDLQMLIRQALDRLATVREFLNTQSPDLDVDDPFFFQPTYVSLVSQSGEFFNVGLSELDALMDIAPSIANIVSSLELRYLPYIRINVSSSALHLLILLARADRDKLFSHASTLSTRELEALKRDAHFLESRMLLDFISEIPAIATSAVKLQSFIRGANVHKETVLPSELADYLDKNLPDFVDSRGDPIDITQLSKILAREILAKKDLPPEGKRLFKQEEEYSFAVHDEHGNVFYREVINLPVGIWVTPVPGGIELELIGRELGDGSFKEIFQSRPITINLQMQDHEKKIEDAVVAHFKNEDEADTEAVLRSMRLLHDAFTPEERQDPNLRIAGDLRLLDRINPRTGTIEARDAEYAGDLENLWYLDDLGFQGLIQVFADVATTLSKFHIKRLAHGDIKRHNILVSKGSRRGFVADLDGLQISGIDETGFHTKSDTLCNWGLVTPFLDIYALATESLSLTDDSEFPPAIDRIREAAEEVISANDKMSDFIESNQDIFEDMDDQAKFEAMIDSINNAFPAYQNFMKVLCEEAAPLPTSAANVW